jgi:hypothetical protein
MDVPTDFRKLTVDDVYRLCRNLRANGCGSYAMVKHSPQGVSPIVDLMVDTQGYQVKVVNEIEAQAWLKAARTGYEQGKEGKAEAAPETDTGTADTSS